MLKLNWEFCVAQEVWKPRRILSIGICAETPSDCASAELIFKEIEKDEGLKMRLLRTE